MVYKVEIKDNQKSPVRYITEFNKDPIEIDFEDEASQEIIEWDEENKKVYLEFLNDRQL